ncbi:MAG: hypothetical protein JKY09_07110 [Crocinitomicaceae bacterium]|nr:hypothetical protein [Crocinitomicaceae bacterium]
MENLHVSIIGCGWLGLQLGKYLKKAGTIVKGSYRSDQGKMRLENNGIDGFLFDTSLKAQISIDMIESTEVLVVSLPPGRGQEMSQYAKDLAHIVQQFTASVKVIFTSSIGVYPKRKGTFDESFDLSHETESALLLAEQKLGEILGEQLTILRLGGLIGPNRHPIKLLQGRTLSDDGSGPINLVHSSDSIAAIQLIIDGSHFGKVYNLVYPNHPSKKNYYAGLLKKYHLAPFQFTDKPSVSRLIDGNKIVEDTGFSYQHDIQLFDDKLYW